MLSYDCSGMARVFKKRVLYIAVGEPGIIRRIRAGLSTMISAGERVLHANGC